MSSELLFSIVIPTRNRAELLRTALHSALRQTFDDYEIVVSDNCSQDNTPEIVRELQTSRVRYVRVDRPLSMPDHWEFALDQARGEYVTFLCDDDAVTAAGLDRVAAAIASHQSKLLVLGSAKYYGSNWFDPAFRNVGVVPPHSGQEIECQSHETLKRIFECRVLEQAPRMINSFGHRETMLRLRAEAKRMFLMCPDYSFAAFMLTDVPSWTYLDEPLHVQGVFAEGIGSSQYYNRGEPSREFIREFGETNLLKRVPLQVPVVTNYIAETLLMCKERMGRRLRGYEIQQASYFIGCWQDLSVHELNGIDVEADKDEVLRVLARQPETVRDAVLSIISPSAPVTGNGQSVAVERSGDPGPVGRLARRLIDRATTLLTSEASSPQPQVVSEVVTEPRTEVAGPEPDPVSAPVVIRGEDAGFGNIFEFANELPRLVRNTNESPERFRPAKAVSIAAK